MFVDITVGCKLGRNRIINSNMKKVCVSICEYYNSNTSTRCLVSGGKSSDGMTVAVAKPMEVIEAAARILVVMLVIMIK